MPCTKCGKSGHNARSCPEAKEIIKNDRNHAIILRVDHMTEQEKDNMHHELVKLKKRITSSEARATLVEGTHKELPTKIRALIERKNDE